MAKAKTAFVCNECGADYAKWQGQCQSCKAWNSLSEIRLTSGKTSPRVATAQDPRYQGYAGATTGIQNLSDVDLADGATF